MAAGSPEVLRRADRLEFSEGADWPEAGVGTNAISESLVTGRPVQLFPAEHPVRTHHEWACTAAPITHPDTGRLLAVLYVSGQLDVISAPPAGWRGGVAGAARRQACRGGVRARQSDSAHAAPGGMLALLASHAQGWAAEELADELYGDAGTPQVIRTEMFRVRSMLGNVVESNPYHFVADLSGCADSRRVLPLLRQGRVAQAFEAYLAPLLSRSGALAVQLLRDQLDLAIGSAVRSSGDAGLLIKWPSTDTGSADAAAVETLGR